MCLAGSFATETGKGVSELEEPPAPVEESVLTRLGEGSACTMPKWEFVSAERKPWSNPSKSPLMHDTILQKLPYVGISCYGWLHTNGLTSRDLE